MISLLLWSCSGSPPGLITMEHKIERVRYAGEEPFERMTLLIMVTHKKGLQEINEIKVGPRNMYQGKVSWIFDPGTWQAMEDPSMEDHFWIALGNMILPGNDTFTDGWWDFSVFDRGGRESQGEFMVRRNDPKEDLFPTLRAPDQLGTAELFCSHKALYRLFDHSQRLLGSKVLQPDESIDILRIESDILEVAGATESSIYSRALSYRDLESGIIFTSILQD